MLESNIELKPVKDLCGMNFFIPSYQRGYRWTEDQVKDLLNDIKEFYEKPNKTDGEIYCIQPLVVIKKVEESEKILDEIKNKAETIDDVKNILREKWEVIDGQQRLTTIYILLSYLNESVEDNLYSIEYETRKKRDGEQIDSAEFLKNIEGNKEKADENIDFYYMYQAYKTIQDWFSKYKNDEEEDNKEEIKNALKATLLEKVNFIWYETDEQNPITVFTRLNIGKIPLTDSELIKALFLNRKNLNYASATQQRIAFEWDNIEFSLQNEEFWLFIQNEENYKKPTRIDFILDYIQINKVFEEFDSDKIGNDEHKTFRYFYEGFKKNVKSEEDVKKYWEKIRGCYQILEEWYNNIEFYHYIGFLIERGEKLKDLLDKWNEYKKESKSKENFKEEFLKNEIKAELSNCNDLKNEYEKGNKPKTGCYPILLLHNIQTVINQNKVLNESRYGVGVFYKFPFHLLKKEKWDIEHIDSNVTNELKSFNEQKEWLTDCEKELKLYPESETKDLLKKIEEFIKSDKEDEVAFGNLVQEIDIIIGKNANRLKESGGNNEKNIIWNYCLLDAGTNRGYGNAIFPAKRRKIIQKDQGRDDGKSKTAFIPPCTKYVFQKYYNPNTNLLRMWDRNDAKAYLDDINKVLSDSGFIDNQSNIIEQLFEGK